MTTEKVAVAPEFLQKVVGFAEATNAMLKQAEESKAELRKVASDAVDALEKAGKLGEHKKEDLIEGFVRQPSMALKLAASMAKEAEDYGMPKKKERTEEEEEEGEDDDDEMEEKEASIGRAAELEAKARIDSKRESDEVWERGFGFSL